MRRVQSAWAGESAALRVASSDDMLDISALTGMSGEEGCNRRSSLMARLRPHHAEFADDVHRTRDVKALKPTGQALQRSENMHKQEYDRIWWYSYGTICAMVGVMLAIIENEVLWANQEAGGEQNFTTFCLKCSILVSSGMAAWCLYEQMVARINLKRLRGEPLPERESFWLNLHRAGLLSEFLVDLALLAIAPVPSLDLNINVWDAGNRAYITYSIDAVLCGLMMIVRVKFLLVCLILLDPLTNTTNLVYARTAGVEVNMRFILASRCMRSARYLLFLWLLTILIMSYLMMMAERPLNAQPGYKDHLKQAGRMDEFHNCLWLVIITMTTVGYGEIYPSSDLGRWVAIVSCFQAVVLMALCINVTTESLSLDDPSERLVGFTYRLREYKSMRVSAVRLIERLYIMSPVHRRLHALDRASYCKDQPGRGAVLEARKRSWKELDRLGLGALGDVTLLRMIHNFRHARQAFQSRENGLRQDTKLQLSEMTNHMMGLETEVEKLVDQLQHCLHKLSAKLG